MLKFNALVIIKDGLKSDSSADTIISFNQLKLIHPDAIINFGKQVDLVLNLANPSKPYWNQWETKYNGIFNINMVHPIYLFHDHDIFSSSLVNHLLFFRYVKTNIIKLSY